MMKKVLLLLVLLLIPTSVVYAHGTAISAEIDGTTITLHAKFDDGAPMSDAQISVFAPVNPRETYLQGVADGSGIFTFEIDPTIVGTWDVRVRIAGHGEMIHFPVAEDGTITFVSGKMPLWQRALIATAILVFLAGVAYYYRIKRTT